MLGTIVTPLPRVILGKDDVFHCAAVLPCQHGHDLRIEVRKGHAARSMIDMEVVGGGHAGRALDDAPCLRNRGA